MSEQKVRNQRNDVLEYLLEHGSITQMEAYFKFPAPITRLSAVIFDLRKQGYDIESEPLLGQNYYGTYRCVRYNLLNSQKNVK